MSIWVCDGRDDNPQNKSLLVEANRDRRLRFFCTKDGETGIGINLNREEVLKVAEELLKHLEETENE